MNATDLDSMKKGFAAYAAGFYVNDPEYDRPLRLKVAHTERVCENIFRLGAELELSPQELMLAETSALFHDVGRFEQYRQYHTFNDKISENHAWLGLKQMRKQGVLVSLTDAEKRFIIQAIAHHNVADLPQGKDEKTLFFIRLLRDADKLDILKIFADYFSDPANRLNATIEIGLSRDPSYSPRLIQALHAHRFARFEGLRTLNDFKLLQISWIFDLNYIPSFQLLKNNRHIEQIQKTLPPTAEIDAAVQEALGYMQVQINGL